jgi:acyl carrier protein
VTGGPVGFDAYEEILRRHLPYVGAGALDGSSSLTDLGLDSLGTAQLLSDLESTLDIEVPDDALTAETFQTVDSLWRAVSAEAARSSRGG